MSARALEPMMESLGPFVSSAGSDDRLGDVSRDWLCGVGAAVSGSRTEVMRMCGTRWVRWRVLIAAANEVMSVI